MTDTVRINSFKIYKSLPGSPWVSQLSAYFNTMETFQNQITRDFYGKWIRLGRIRWCVRCLSVQQLPPHGRGSRLRCTMYGAPRSYGASRSSISLGSFIILGRTCGFPLHLGWLDYGKSAIVKTIELFCARKLKQMLIDKWIVFTRVMKCDAE